MRYNEISKLDSIVILILCIPVYAFFSYIDQAFRGFVAALSVGVILALTRLFRSLYSKREFWGVLFVISALHAVLVYGLPYTGEFRFGFILFPVVFADLHASAYLIRFACGLRNTPK